MATTRRPANPEGDEASETASERSAVRLTAPAATWHLYDLREGLGSVYGRYVRNQLCQRLLARYNIRTVLEAPANSESYFASPGTQSLVFALAGCAVTLVHQDPAVVDQTRAIWEAAGLWLGGILQHRDLTRFPFEDASFDLVWNFDAIPLEPDPAAVVAEMARVSRGLVMVVVANARNVGYPLYAAANWIGRRPALWGTARWMNRSAVEGALRSAGLRVIESGLVDMPPWPGFDVLQPIVRLARGAGADPQPAASSDEAMERFLDRLTFIERSRLPRVLKSLCAHQIYVVARKESSTSPV